MKNARILLFRISLVTFASALLAAGCGDSKSDPAATATAGASGGGGSANTATGASRAGAAGTGGTGTNEGNPNVSLVDPNRDMSIPINLAESGAVSCGGGGDFCIPPSLTCCTSGTPGGMNTFSCASSSSACPDGTVTSADCSSGLSCGAGQLCCQADNDEGGTTASCETACADGADQLCVDDDECAGGGVCNNGTCGPPACTADSCATGELCCRAQLGGFNVAAPACVAGATCPGGSQQVCADATDCPADNTCAAVGFGQNNVLVCTPPPCTPTSCGAGQECCVGAQLGGNPTCVPSDPATQVCPGNSRVVCITDAECEVVAGTACLLNPQGGGSLSCRVPPPAPVGDAGAADGG
jgi:hypothetical protein